MIFEALRKLRFRWWTLRLTLQRARAILGRYELPKVLTTEETVDAIAVGRLSAARFGDGEFSFISNYLHNELRHSSKFQKFSPRLGQRLLEVLECRQPDPNLLVCIPGPFMGQDLKRYKPNSIAFWCEAVFLFPDIIARISNRGLTFGDSLFTRFYMAARSKKDTARQVENLRKIWDGRNVLVVEGRFSRLGVGNDLFDNANSVRRILCPEKDAFEHYDEILHAVSSHVSSGDLVLAALGMTATVLAADMSAQGIQTIDIGHIDIEYEWWRHKAETKAAVPHKFTNEVAGDVGLEDFHDPLYDSQIIDRIST